jgi:hypothetical protein
MLYMYSVSSIKIKAPLVILFQIPERTVNKPKIHKNKTSVIFALLARLPPLPRSGYRPQTRTKRRVYQVDLHATPRGSGGLPPYLPSFGEDVFCQRILNATRRKIGRKEEFVERRTPEDAG